VAERYILQQLNMSEEVNKLPARNMTVQLSTAYTDHERHNAQSYRRTDPTVFMPRADHTTSRSTIGNKFRIMNMLGSELGFKDFYE